MPRCEREGMNNDDLDTIRTILKSSNVATVTTRSGDALRSRPLAIVSEDDFDGTLWFFTQHPSPKTNDIAEHPEVNVAVSDNKGHLSLSGTASVDRDPARIDRYWNPWAEAWFDGRDDPTIALLRVDVDTAEYWSIDKPAVARAFEVVKGLVTKQQPDVGENKTVSL